MSKHWTKEEHEDVVTLNLDVADQSANVLSREVLSELDTLLLSLAEKPPKGVIIRSAKARDFILGADVHEFQHIEDVDEATELARAGQMVLDKIAAQTSVTVAVINGNCLGGGTELALACDYRVALEDPTTRIGLPEVRLGIHPGFGGTVRLPPLVGPLSALDMMLTGRSLSARAARRIGLVDVVAPKRHLMHAALALIAKPINRKLAWRKRILNQAPLRPLVANLVRRQLQGKARKEHYPAPYRILDLWRRGASQEEEARSLGEMLTSDTSRNLVRVFLLGEGLKKHGRGVAHNIKRVHIVGAGVMGGDIAAWAALKGFHVSLQDMKPEALARAVKHAHKLFKKKLKAPIAIQEAMDRLYPDLAGNGLRRADLVIEAIIENLEIKQKVFADIEKKVPAHTVLATNTSGIPLEDIGKGLQNPGRLIGLHFFNPVAKMQLVEIVRGAQSDEDSLARGRAFTVALARLPLDVKSSPGFLVNRILMPYLIEAMMLVEDGVSLTEIDNAALKFGMPMGPIHLADTVGLDICLSVAEELAEPLGVPVPKKLREMVGRGDLGRKSGKGFYGYDKKGLPQKPPTRSASLPIAERLTMRLLNESMACLREGVVTDADAVDAGMVYGTGFAPFRGGPLHYAAVTGREGVSHSLYRLQEEYGKRFSPDSGWSDEGLMGDGAA
ncbi:MAG: 3-hydroxyacyl-CoA dehydrogenase NAD-binding domain-containing protein [Gammaproteobacteria bacterium]|nr:MAG: 3-hydroxyacyl-CoA dehydrogenase NAD-binding domain-containing protein [Gammaproteobacteria bacterium]